MAIQKEYKEISKDKSFEELFKEKMEKYKDVIIEFEFNNEVNLTLEEMKGQILFFDFLEGRIDLRLGIEVQNEWVFNYKKNIIDKKRKLKRFFNKSILLLNIKNFFINYLSDSSD